MGRCVLSAVSTCLSFLAGSNPWISFNSADLSGSSSGTSSSLNVCAVGVGFFSSVSTCFNCDLSNDFTSARESAFSSSMTDKKHTQNINSPQKWRTTPTVHLQINNQHFNITTFGCLCVCLRKKCLLSAICWFVAWRMLPEYYALFHFILNSSRYLSTGSYKGL